MDICVVLECVWWIFVAENTTAAENSNSVIRYMEKWGKCSQLKMITELCCDRNAKSENEIWWYLVFISDVASVV